MAERFPGRVFDVGIAEQHAVVFACGMAIEGYRPVWSSSKLPGERYRVVLSVPLFLRLRDRPHVDGGELLIDAGKETKKCGILQKGVAHFVGLLAW